MKVKMISHTVNFQYFLQFELNINFIKNSFPPIDKKFNELDDSIWPVVYKNAHFFVFLNFEYYVVLFSLFLKQCLHDKFYLILKVYAYPLSLNNKYCSNYLIIIAL